jgi:hypothetical protein
MDDDGLLDAAAVGARRAGVHLLRAASEVVAGLVAFVEEIGKAFGDDDDEDGVEHINVEDDDD